MRLTEKRNRVINPATRHTEHYNIEILKINYRAIIVLANREVLFISGQAINEPLHIIAAFLFSRIAIGHPVGGPEYWQIRSAGYFFGLGIIVKPPLEFVFVVFGVGVRMFDPKFNRGIQKRFRLCWYMRSGECSSDHINIFLL